MKRKQQRVKSNTPWETHREVLRLYSLDKTVQQTVKHLQLNAEEFQPVSKDTVSKLRRELPALGIGLCLELLREVPEIRDFLLEKRQDWKRNSRDLSASRMRHHQGIRTRGQPKPSAHPAH
jgi:hypothetical protein